LLAYFSIMPTSEPPGSSDDKCDGSRQRKTSFLDALHFLTTGTTLFGSACDMNIFYLSAVGFLIFFSLFLGFRVWPYNISQHSFNLFFLGFDPCSFNFFYFYLNRFIELNLFFLISSFNKKFLFQIWFVFIWLIFILFGIVFKTFFLWFHPSLLDLHIGFYLHSFYCYSFYVGKFFKLIYIFFQFHLSTLN
jgi:hypothetical protein